MMLGPMLTWPHMMPCDAGEVARELHESGAAEVAPQVISRLRDGAPSNCVALQWWGRAVVLNCDTGEWWIEDTTGG